MQVLWAWQACDAPFALADWLQAELPWFSGVSSEPVATD
jgi:hypothetical protein